jgi:ferric-dicitrate binding protein FerR (iron transport regulator)
VKKKDLSVQDLTKNPSFRRMIKGIASAEEIEKWNQWIELSIENRQKANDAITQIIGFEFQTENKPDIEQEWKRLRETTIDKSRKTSGLNVRRNDNSRKWIYRAVAAILLVGLVGASLFIYNDEKSSIPQLEQLTEERTITTEPGENKTLQFSNGSKVILNSNSFLTYRIGNTRSSTIEITLDGEAWFDADPDNESDQPAFAVTTPDGIIRDIGTKFLVNVESGLSRIVLQEGMVEVEPSSPIESNTETEELKFRVEQGEMVEFRRTDIISRRKVNPSFYSSWATGELKFTESNLQDFTRYVEERFDVEVELRDSSLEDIKLNGTVYFRSLDELMRSVSDVIGIPVYRSADRDKVYIGNMR